MPIRFDRASYRKPKKQANGYLRADATLTRVGVFEYELKDGTTRRELRLPEEVFHQDSLESFSMVPVTRDHPPVALTASNTHEHQVGVVGELPRKDGDHVLATILLTDEQAITEVEAGNRRELSCGYNCDLEQKPGEWNGQKYDAIQRKIRGNHVALVSKGRAGPEVRIRLDAADAVMKAAPEGDDPRNDEQPPPGGTEKNMRKVLINGVWVEVSDQAEQALLVERQHADEASKKTQEDLRAATARADKEQARADGLKEQLDKAEKERKDAADPKKLQAAVAARVALVKQAADVLDDDFKMDSLSDEELKAAVLKKLCPELKLDGKSADYVQGRYEQALEAFEKDERADAVVRVRRAAEGVDEEHEDEDDISAEEARAKMVSEYRDLWKPKKSA